MKQGNFKKKKENGITLIALVVTIVILLILSGVTINMLIGENGIIRTAQEAKNTWEGAIANEQEEIQNLVNELNNIMNENGNSEEGSGGDDKPTVPPEWDTEKVTPVPSEDEPSINVPVPKGFTPSTVDGEKTVEGGFVIKQDGTNNEFVWIPVDKTSFDAMYTEVETPVALAGETGVTTGIYSKLRYTTDAIIPGTTNGSREPDLVLGDSGSEFDAVLSNQQILGANSTQEFAQDMVKEYKEIHDSIEKYGGFYIGRYELTGTIGSPSVQKGGEVIGNENWYNLKAACIKIVNNENKQENEIVAKTTMIYGNQWDEVCNWLTNSGYDVENSTNWGNYSNNTEEGAGTKQTAGYKESWKANNIYDFAGNCNEWTQEVSYTYNRVYRGGYYDCSGSDYPASIKYGDYPTYDDYSDYSTRPTLYIT